MKTLFIAIVLFFLTACSSTNRSGVSDAASAPLADLNLVKDDIPEILSIASAAPYALPEDISCDAISAEIDALDQVLAPDIDSEPADEGAGAGKKAGRTIGKAAIGALRSTAEDLIPFRGWVRKLTGAERHSKKVSEAIGAGILRRAFLKGVRSSRTCPSGV